MRANYHTHTRRCLHAQGSERDYVEAALRAELDVLGFSDHAPFPSHPDFGLRMPYGELGEYLDAVDGLRQEFRGRLTIYKGLEIEYLRQDRAYLEALARDLDYLILGEHLYEDARGIIRNIYCAQSTEDYVDYALAMAEGMKTGLFAAAAHPDLFALNPFAWDGSCERASDILVETALLTGTALEYNANGLRRGVHDYPDGPRLMYPHPKFWEKAAGVGVPVVIGSDCHEPGQVWDRCLPAAQEQLRSLGIAPLDCLEGLGP